MLLPRRVRLAEAAVPRFSSSPGLSLADVPQIGEFGRFRRRATFSVQKASYAMMCCWIRGIMKGSVRYTRMESITAYTNKRDQPRTCTAGKSDTPVSANDICFLDEWPSHAHRNHALLEDEAKGRRRKGEVSSKVLKHL